MSNKHFCQGPFCHERNTQDRFLKSRGVIRGRYASIPLDHNSEYYKRGKFFCSTNCESLWLDEHMESIEQGRPIEFIRHRRETGGYEKVTDSRTDYYGTSYKTSSIQRIDNRTEID
jgi:hypothetical protein